MNMLSRLSVSLLILSLMVVAGCDEGGPTKAQAGGPGGASPQAKEDKDKPNDKPDDKPKTDTPRVVLETNHGKIVLELDAKKAPITTKNFLTYVDDGFYDNTIFHRVMKDFMVQGGGFTEDLKKKKTLSPIKNEAKNGLKNKRGTIAMARTPDPNSATAQFFINVVDNPGLDYPKPDNHGYAVFGKVVDGMDVVDKIREVRVKFHSRQFQHLPTRTVMIKSARRMK